MELKSVSTYGWRVDIERLRSKYFVDLMRNKDDKNAIGPGDKNATIDQKLAELQVRVTLS